MKISARHDIMLGKLTKLSSILEDQICGRATSRSSVSKKCNILDSFICNIGVSDRNIFHGYFHASMKAILVVLILMLTLTVLAYGQTKHEREIDDFEDEIADFINRGEDDEAIRVSDDAISLFPNDSDLSLIWDMRGHALYHIGKYDGAIRSWDEANRVNPIKHMTIHNSNGEYHRMTYDEDIRGYDGKLNPDFALAWYNKGAALAGQGRYDEAIEAFDGAIRVDPNLFQPRYSRGVALDLQGKNNDSIQAFEEALNIDPTDVRAWLGKGIAFKRDGKYDEAIQAYNQAIRLDPNLASAYYNNGVALGLKGKLEEALKALEQAINLDSNYAAAFYVKAHIPHFQFIP